MSWSSYTEMSCPTLSLVALLLLLLLLLLLFLLLMMLLPSSELHGPFQGNWRESGPNCTRFLGLPGLLLGYQDEITWGRSILLDLSPPRLGYTMAITLK
jgi:hypothetical protein